MLTKCLYILWIIIKFIWNIVKHIFLLPFYCSLPDKYNGLTYNDWLDGNDKNE